MNNNRDFKKALDDASKALVNARSDSSVSQNNIINGSNNNAGHPNHWTDDQYLAFAKRWIQEISHMTSWRDNPKAGPPFSSDKDRVEKLREFPEPFLQECVRYQTTVNSIDYWFKLSPEERYQRRKERCDGHECSVWARYGNSYVLPGKPGCSSDRGCIEECRYYLPTGTIEDNEVLGWYRDIIGDRDYKQLKQENNQFLQEFVRLLKKQVNEIPTNTPYQKDYYKEYYPSIMDI